MSIVLNMYTKSPCHFVLIIGIFYVSHIKSHSAHLPIPLFRNTLLVGFIKPKFFVASGLMTMKSAPL